MLPTDEFKSTEELERCCKMWQEILFLRGWIIHPTLNSPKEFTMEGVMGECEFDTVNKAARIRILEKKFYEDRILRYCAEKILVHELLHCKYNMIGCSGTYESSYVDMVEHGLLEEMAKSLIMAKYNLTLKYFDSASIGMENYQYGN